MENYLVMYGIGIPAVIMGLVQIAKVIGVEKKYTYLLSLFLGVFFAVGYVLYGDYPVFEANVVGLVLGLAAMGMYDTVKKTGDLIRGD